MVILSFARRGHIPSLPHTHDDGYEATFGVSLEALYSGRLFVRLGSRYMAGMEHDLSGNRRIL